MFWKIYNNLFILLAKIWLIWFISVLNVVDFIYKTIFFNVKNKTIAFYYVLFIQYFCIFLGSTTIFFLFILRPGYEGNISISAPAARYIAKMLGVEVTIRNGEHLAAGSAAIATINHQSLFDLLITLHFWDIPKKFTVLGKSELKYLPPYGPMGILAGLQFVTRNNIMKAREQLKKITSILKERKVKMLVYPEGTRNQNPAEFLPFKKGAFHTAISAQIPIIPVVISPYYFMNSNKKIFEPGRVIIQFLEPVPTEGLTETDVPALTEKVRDLMFKTYQQLSKEVLPAEAENSVDLGLTQQLL